MITPEVLWELANKKLTSTLSEEENQRLNNWLEQSDDNREQWKNTLLLWERTSPAPDPTAFNSRRAWIKVADRIDSKKKTVRFYISRVAAAIALVSLTVIVYHYSKQVTDSPPPIVYVTKSGETKEIHLPDSSTVWLNENSELSYINNFSTDTTRTVRLKGEAFFEVDRQPDKPFIIINSSFVTRVLGTSFNLNLQNTDPSLIVVTGTVKFTHIKREQESSSFIVRAGDQVRLQNEQLVKTTIDKNKLAWHTGVLEFQNENLETVIRDLSELYHVSIKVVAPKLNNYRYSGVIDHLPVETALEAICFSLNLSWIKTPTGYQIQSNS